MSNPRKKLNPKETAFLVIDVQKRFCDPAGKLGTKRTAEISKKIQEAAKAFRKKGISTYAIYFSNRARPRASTQEAGFYIFTPEKEDKIIPKTRSNAFTSSPLLDVLQKNNIKNIIFAGFNIRACIYTSVTSALAHKFNVHLAEDLSGSDRAAEKWRDACSYKQMMKQKGARLCRSTSVLKQIG